MPDKIEVIAIITAKPDRREALKEELAKLAKPSCAEAGCEKYELQEDIQNPDRFFVVETWKSSEALDEHIKTPHFQNFLKNAETLMENLDPAIIKPVT